MSFPGGDGHPECPVCQGRGAVRFKLPGMITPATKPCECVKIRDKLARMERVWKGMSTCAAPERTPLSGFLNRNCRITTTQANLKAHLHRLLWEVPNDFVITVESDRELAKAWLYTAKISGDAYDSDVVQHEVKYVSLEDLSDYSDLLVVLVGVKVARNSASPELLLDVARGRDFKGKPTWVVDDPSMRLGPGHISYSDHVGDYFRKWRFLSLDGYSAPEVESPTKISVEMRGSANKMPDAPQEEEGVQDVQAEEEQKGAPPAIPGFDALSRAMNGADSGQHKKPKSHSKKGWPPK